MSDKPKSRVGCLLVILLGIVGGVCLHASRQPRGYREPSGGTTPGQPPPGRTYIPQSCAEVAHIFGSQSGNTEMQQDALWRNYENQWVRWNVRVGEVTETLGQLQMQFRCTHESFVLDGTAIIDDSMRAQLMQVHQGATVQIDGRLTDHGRLLGLHISDATFVDPNAAPPPSANPQPASEGHHHHHHGT